MCKSKKGLVSVLGYKPFSLLSHYLYHHPGTQLEAVLEDQAVRDGLILPHRVLQVLIYHKRTRSSFLLDDQFSLCQDRTYSQLQWTGQNDP